MDKLCRTMTRASENSLTFQCGSSSSSPTDVSADVRGECDSVGASAAFVECVQ
jgi:hypothetical protein